MLSSSTGLILTMPGAGVLALLLGLGMLGSGHVTSLSSSAQNWRMLSKKYHCLSALRPFGRINEGYSVGFGHHGCEVSSKENASLLPCRHYEILCKQHQAHC